jgi:hypothetical protein
MTQQYTQQHKELAKKFLRNGNVAFDYDAEDMRISIGIDVNDRIWTDGTSIWSETQAKKGVKVESLSLCATHSKASYSEEDWADLEEDALYWSGSLDGYAYYDGTGKDGTWCDGEEYSIEEKGGLVNGVKREGTGDGYIYTDDGFTANLEKFMTEQCDFDRALFAYLSFDYSEQGMQAEGAVNFDVEMEGDFWLAVHEEMEQEDDKLRAKAAC